MTQSAPQTFAATGRRKSSVAHVTLAPGDGRIVVNKRTAEEYFPRGTLRQVIEQPFEATGQSGRFLVTVRVEGGGVAGQAGATRHAIARALERFDPSLRATLKRAGFLTRDPRAKERKKYGQRGARARFQFSKR